MRVTFAFASSCTVTHRTTDEPVRLDKWLWAARFFKTRALAAEAIDKGHVDVNDDKAKRSRNVHPGDRITIRRPPFEHRITVLMLSDQRGPATVASTMYEESAESRARRELTAAQIRAAGPSVDGRPTKRDRREIDRWRGRA
ncbi:MAG: RNA-binding S4 domain-containing protein [Gemmatimonadetes bacterium]|nr:RNA-binding S4 domain-containing protein [Gemmatimonadota bacterium]